jgi:hypothetical protein
VRRGWLESCPKRTGSPGVPDPRFVPRCEGMVRTIYLVGGVSLFLEVSHHIEKVVGMLGLGVVSLLYIPSLVVKTSMGERS